MLVALLSDVDFLIKMDSCRLVPLYNLIKYHISRGVEEVKHTEEVSTEHIDDLNDNPEYVLGMEVTPCS